MGRSPCARSFLVVCGILLLATAARADDNDDLRLRIERLEQQNLQLMRTLEEMMQQNGPVAPTSATAPAEGEKEKLPAPKPDEKGAEKPKEEKKEEKKEETEKVYVVGSDPAMKVYWRYGLEAATADEAFKVHVGGRVQFDAAWIGTSQAVMFGKGGIGRADDAVNFRRARLDVEATMWEQIDFYAQYDFLNTFSILDKNGDAQAFNVPVPTDLWATFTKVPYLGNIRVGNQKPPISFEHLVSSRFLDFLERSLAFDAFVENGDNGFEPGIQAFNWFCDERGTWSLGLFKNNRNVFGWNVGDGEGQLTGRLTFLPWYEDEGRYLLHLGLGAYVRDTDNDLARYRARILVRNGPAVLHNIIAEARMLGDTEALVVPELAMVVGPFTLQAEYYGNWVFDAVAPITPEKDRQPKGTVFYQGFYVQALYFLTGENRSYNRATSFGDRRRVAVFDRVIPYENAFCLEDAARHCVFGHGAWQVGLRYCYLDLDEKGINGGSTSNGAVIHDWTLGLNWFINPNMKVQWNYDLALRQAIGGKSDGVIHAFGTRLAFDF